MAPEPMPNNLSRIVAVRAREVLDSRGNPTVEAEVKTGGSWGRASVPSGASKGKREALELRDDNPRRFHGKGVLKAVGNVNKIVGPKLLGFDCSDQAKVDRAMIRIDGTKNKSRLGANGILSVSMAAAWAAANGNHVSLFRQLNDSRKYTLPIPMMNVINGGEHAGNELAIQEFLIEPVGGRTCTEAIRMGVEVYQSLKGVLTSKYGRSATNVGDEGGFAPQLGRTRDALDAIRAAIRGAGYGEKEVRIGIDAAASTFFDSRSGLYTVDGISMDGAKLEDFYSSLKDEFALLTIEDPFEEGGFDSFASITRRMGRNTAIIGDDIYVTNVSLIRKGVRAKCTNAVLIKLNQIGTVTETKAAIELCAKAAWEAVVSHRSGETADPFIAHLATAYGAPFIKTGAPARGERVSKYNELIRIDEELGPKAGFAGSRFR
ncbi:MAG: phosphopyruvate hydratase [Nitrososphaerota archaeon]|nr:phosphopyruvate hydratase [Nitrososphaerota archaeon]